MKKALQLATLAIALIAANQASLSASDVGPPLPECGTPCFDEGAGRGCREYAPGGIRRVTCICLNGSWYCD